MPRGTGIPGIPPVDLTGIPAAVWAAGARTLTAGINGKMTAATGNYFMYPAGPTTGTALTTGGFANQYGAWVQMIAATAADIYVVGYLLRVENNAPGTLYMQLDIGVGAGGAEVSIGEGKEGYLTYSAVGVNSYGFAMFPFPIPVAAGARIACRVASNTAGLPSQNCTLLCINQADVVDM